MWTTITEQLTHHAGDCTVYSSLCNENPEDGICTCGYGWQQVRKGDRSKMYSQERLNAVLSAGSGYFSTGPIPPYSVTKQN